MSFPREAALSDAPREARPGWTPRDEQLAALMRRVALADRRAFQTLYEITGPLMFAIVLRINKDRSAAEDILQEVFLAAWRQAPRYDSDQGRVLPWLSTMARHRAIDSLRRQAAQPTTLTRLPDTHMAAQDVDDTDVLTDLASDEPGPLELLDRASQAHDLARCMRQLSGEQRSCLALAYYQGLSHAEVAHHMSQPLGTVKSWARRGLQSLKHCLDRAVRDVGQQARGH